MKDFRLYDISDFVIDEDFIRWVHERREEDNLFWNGWLQQHPDKHLVIATARRIVESIQFKQTAIDEQTVELEVNRLLHTIRKEPVERVSPKGMVISFKWWYAAAAVLLLSATGSWYFFFRNNSVPVFAYTSMVAAKQLIEHINTSGKPLVLTLPDGSRITLASGSRVSYAHTFGSADTAKNGVTRDVYLLGEAFFEVTKNPHRPFRVFANEIVTKVLGTSFTVRSFEKDTTIQVIVRTGKVSVYAQPAAVSAAKSEIILTPNQQLVYERSQQKFQKVLLNNPAMIMPPVAEKTLVYDEAPLDQVFSDLSKAYGINIVFDNDLLKKCTVTADLTNESFYRKLVLICGAIDAHYEVIDGQVVIESSGCK